MNSTAPVPPNKPPGRPMTITVTPREGPATTLICVPVPPVPALPSRYAYFDGYSVRSRPGEAFFRELFCPAELTDAVAMLTEVGQERYELVARAYVPELRTGEIAESRWDRAGHSWTPWQVVDIRGTKGVPS